MIVRQSLALASAESAIALAGHGTDVSWDVQSQLLAGVFDGVQTLAWLQTEDGSKGTNRPQPLPRPGVRPAETAPQRSVSDVKAWLAKRNPSQHT